MNRIAQLRKLASKSLTFTAFLILLAMGCSKKSDPAPASSTTPAVDDRDLFLGTWNWDAAATYPGGTSVPFYDGMTISKGTAANALQIAFASSATTVINGTLIGNVITFAPQTVDGTNFSGTMTMTKLIIDVKLTSVGNGVTSTLIGSAEKGVLDFESSDLFEGNWKGTWKTVCTPGGTSNATGIIGIASTATKNQVNVAFLGAPAIGIVSGKNIAIANQKVLGYNIQGSVALTGSILTNSLAISYSYTIVSTNIFSVPPVTSTCVYTGTAKRN